jgi:hypothetical protein
MRRFFKIITWQFADMPIKRSAYLFNYFIRVSRHFPGISNWSLTFYYEGGMIGYQLKGFERWEIDQNFDEKKIEKKGSLQRIDIRLGNPWIQLSLTKDQRELTKEYSTHYQITY